MVSWDECAKRLDELGMYQRIVEESGISSSKNALTVDLGCGRGYLLKELYKANPLMCTAGVDEKLGDCRRYLKSEKIPFSELASKKLVKKAPKLHVIYLVEENYRKIPKRAFDLSFMLFPSVTGYDRTGKDYDERLLATFMTCVQTLKRAILASNTAKIKSTVVIANLAGGGQASEYKRAGIFAKEKSMNIPISDRTFTKLYKALYGSKDVPNLYLTVGKPKEIDKGLMERINALDIVSNKKTRFKDGGRDALIYYATKGKFFEKDYVAIPKEFIGWVLGCFKPEK